MELCFFAEALVIRKAASIFAAQDASACDFNRMQPLESFFEQLCAGISTSDINTKDPQQCVLQESTFPLQHSTWFHALATLWLSYNASVPSIHELQKRHKNLKGALTWPYTCNWPASYPQPDTACHMSIHPSSTHTDRTVASTLKTLKIPKQNQSVQQPRMPSLPAILKRIRRTVRYSPPSIG